MCIFTYKQTLALLRKKLNLPKCLFILLSISLVGTGCKKQSVLTPESMGFKKISSATFLMGSSSATGAPNESPQHTVTLSAFYINATELTRDFFSLFLQSKDTCYLASNQKTMKDYSSFFGVETDAQPIVNVSWFTAIAYCNWLTKTTGSIDTCYTFTLKQDGTIDAVSFDRTKKGYRLPTEAEWEYACRAETKTAYSFGDDASILGDYAWTKANSMGTTHIVGEKKPNPFGLYDMYGNISEWCWDWYDSYTSEPKKDPTGTVNNMIDRILRGSSWGNADNFSFRSANRGSFAPNNRSDYVGFRLAKTL